jgi:4-amino-4-deoxy-L-arabinose transferase-like glycosyltransferase
MFRQAAPSGATPSGATPAGATPRAAGPTDATAARWLWPLIAGTLLLRLLVATLLDLGIDEAYAVAVARPLAASYFDHPPLVFWLAAGMEWLTGSSAAPVVRLPFVLLFAGTTWAIAQLGTRLFGARAGLLGAIVLNVTGLFGFAHGTWVVPDGPLLFGLALAAERMAAILVEPAADPAVTARRWLVVGLAAGMAALAKYHAIFLPLGLLAFLVTTRRWALLRSPWPWVAALVALGLCLPVLAWNAEHDWASLRFQTGRAGGAAGRGLDPLFENLGGQAGYVLPWVWGPMLWAAWGALRRGPADARRWLLLCLAAGPLLVFTLATLGGSRGLPHWPGPGYLFLAPLLGAALDARLRDGRAWPRRWLRGSAIAIVALAALIVSQARTGWVSTLAPALFAKGDPSHEVLAWHTLPAALRAWPAGEPAPAFIAAVHWMEAARIGSVLRDAPAGNAPPLRLLAGDARHFAFRPTPAATAGRAGLLVRRARATPLDDDTRARFADVTLLTRVPVTRGGRTAFELEVYRASGLREATR